MKTALVFGTFDGLHDGHRSFLTQARAQADRLIVVVAPDESVRTLKHREPRQNESMRRELVAAVDGVALAVLGDRTLGTYQVIRTHEPDLIVIGHDQQALEMDLQRWMEEQSLSLPIFHADEYVEAGKNA